ncbi:GNAT family N-acetyltransferase, partial [Pseudomonas sp. RIT-PI-AD]|uniref:GNAT family N-acetyltransferase n=1 Tax=Pseudomonas sp. RIT-PI-AD TaxID=3035294 RepID=UPI0021D91FDC
MHLDIRPLGRDDHAAWLPLWEGYQRFYATAIPPDTSARTWQRFLDPAEPMHAALAWRDGEALGLVHFIYHRSCWTTGDYCYLQDLFVAESLRGAGVGRQLIEHVYREAAAAGCSRVHWLTHESNHTAMQLYDRLAERSGFVQYRHL